MERECFRVAFADIGIAVGACKITDYPFPEQEYNLRPNGLASTTSRCLLTTSMLSTRVNKGKTLVEVWCFE